MYDIAVVGGGLAGLINAILLRRAGLSVILFEKNQYPFHRVCGEYISNEVIPFLENHQLFPAHLAPSSILQLMISSTKGKSFSAPLDLGGFGVSRYAYDAWLVEQAVAAGVVVRQQTTIQQIHRNGSFMLTTAKNEVYESGLVIAAFGKRSKLDQSLDRSFIKHRSPYVGVKYHMRLDFPEDLIALHNFPGGYCGVSKVEGDRYNVCYLVHRDQVKTAGSIKQMELRTMYQNRFLKEIFTKGEHLFKKPEVINEISFEKKEPVLDEIFMTGDAAGMITPLCGNGMAMAIHSAKLLSESIIDQPELNRTKIAENYTRQWNQQFASRLWVGRKIQSAFFGSPLASTASVITGKYVRPIAKWLIAQTHGQPF